MVLSKSSLKYCRLRGTVGCVFILIAVQLVIVMFGQTHIRHVRSSVDSTLFIERKHDKLSNQSVQDYYKSHYGTCEFSLIREKSINCVNLIANNNTNGIARIRANKTRRCDLVRITEDCDLFRRINGYDSKEITEEERNFPLAFGIRLHTAPELVEQILRILYRPHNFYCLHVDTGSSRQVYEALQAVAKCFDNVVVFSVIRTVYSSVRLIEADLLCMNAALRSPIKWKYYLNMAGQELPIKTNLEIVRACQSLQGKNDIESEKPNSVSVDRILYHHIVDKVRPRRTKYKKESFDMPIEFRKGAAYGMMVRDFVDFVIHDSLAQRLLNFLSDTEAPEESFFSTLNFVPGVPGGRNATVSHSAKNWISRAVIWMWDGILCPGVYRRGVCTLHNGALYWLTQQREIIANKVDSNYDQILIDCMEEYLKNKSATTA